MNERRGQTAGKKPMGQSGISMVLVVVMLMVFLIMGAAVLGASAATTAAASRNGADRQAYYYARSAVDVLDASLRQDTGEDSLGDMVLRAAASSGGTLDFAPNVALPANRGLDGLAVKVTFTGDCTLTDLGGTATRVDCPLLEMTVTTTYREEQAYVIYVLYRCTGAVASDGTGTVTGASWTVLQVK